MTGGTSSRLPEATETMKGVALSNPARQRARILAVVNCSLGLSLLSICSVDVRLRGMVTRLVAFCDGVLADLGAIEGQDSR